MRRGDAEGSISELALFKKYIIIYLMYASGHGCSRAAFSRDLLGPQTATFSLSSSGFAPTLSPLPTRTPVIRLRLHPYLIWITLKALFPNTVILRVKTSTYGFEKCEGVASDSLCPMGCPGKNTGVGCHALLQGIFTQRLNSGLLHCRRILHHLSQTVKKWKEPNGTESKILHSCRSHEVSLYLLTWKAAMIYDMVVVFCVFLGPHPAACRILGSQRGIEAKPSAVKPGSLNHWAARESPELVP